MCIYTVRSYCGIVLMEACEDRSETLSAKGSLQRDKSLTLLGAQQTARRQDINLDLDWSSDVGWRTERAENCIFFKRASQHLCRWQEKATWGVQYIEASVDIISNFISKHDSLLGGGPHFLGEQNKMEFHVIDIRKHPLLWGKTKLERDQLGETPRVLSRCVHWFLSHFLMGKFVFGFLRQDLTVAQSGLELPIQFSWSQTPPAQPPKCLNYRQVPSYSARLTILSKALD